jgi:hypothetical protein
LISADGVAGPPVYIFADEYMPTDGIDVHEQRTIAAGAAQHGTAYVAFMKSWVPNKEFYRWFNKTVLIPYVANQRNVLEAGEKTAAFFTLDGENNQIGVMEELPEIKSLDEASPIVAKPPASNNHIPQPCDVVSGLQTGFKLVKDNDVSQDKNIDRLATMLKKSHIAKYTSIAAQRGKRAKRLQMSAALKVCGTRYVENSEGSTTATKRARC